ncbi:MAG TPA: hypothetical protein VNZ94_00480 [Xanthobacteraceae bacterium]|nr:hypothetical protein [Xanthobacteraceae bacterium]
MSDFKVATPSIAKATWDEMDSPSCRAVEEKLKQAGYITPSYRTINTWAKEGDWQRKTKEKHPRGRKSKEKKVRENLTDAAAVLTGDPRTRAEQVVEAVMNALPPPDVEGPPRPNDEPKVEEESEADGIRNRLTALRNAITGENITDESLLTEAARQNLRTAIIISGLLAEMAPHLMSVNPEAVGKLHLAVSESLAAASEPYDRIAVVRERGMKTVGSQVIEAGAEDPLADTINAYKSAHAA